MGEECRSGGWKQWKGAAESGVDMRKRLVDGEREGSVWELTLDDYISLLVSVFY